MESDARKRRLCIQAASDIQVACFSAIEFFDE